MSDLEAKLKTIQDQLQSAARRCEQPRPQLLAVSKKHSAAAIRELFQAGQAAFGESYLQEALQKQAELSDLDIEWHFIGPIQSNKTRDIANHFSWVHSVDRLKVARRLNDQLAEDHAPLNVLVQVNIDNEASKSGATPDELTGLCTAIQALPNLKLRGLMCIPQKQTDFAQQRAGFARLRTLFEQLKEAGFNELDSLSMGMSNDYEAAIAEGSTLVRIGTALFGSRD